MREHLGKELGEVGEVLAEEVGLEHEGFPGVIRVQLAAEELGLAGDAESGAFLGVLRTRSKLAHLLLMRQQKLALPPNPPIEEPKRTCLEGELLQSDRQARKRFVSGAGFRDNGEAGGRAIVVSRSDLDAGDVGRLV